MGSGASGGDVKNVIGETEQEKALALLYEETHGNGWKKNAGWRVDSMGRGYGDVSGYSGVTQDSNNYVVRLNLPRNRMTGTLPSTEAFAYAMSELRLLDLQQNEITGLLPPTFALMSNLTELNLEKNNLRGALSDGMGNLINLKKLKLNCNNLKGKLPITLSKLSNLHQLWLHRNYKLCGQVDMLGHLTSLVRLKLNENSFTGEIPATFTNLISIKEFYIQGNNMSITNDAGELRQDNEKVLDILRKRCTVMCILEDQVQGAGWLKSHQPPGELYRNTPAMYGASIASISLPSHPTTVYNQLNSVRNEYRDMPTY